jgi:hypothetical protein
LPALPCIRVYKWYSGTRERWQIGALYGYKGVNIYMFEPKNLSQLKAWLKTHIGEEYTIHDKKHNYISRRELAVVQSNSFAGKVLDDEKDKGRNSWIDYPKVSDIEFTQTGFIFTCYDGHKLEYIFDCACQ